MAVFTNLLTCIYRPTGWDNLKKIGILEDNLTSIKPNDSFNDVIVKPVNRKVSVATLFLIDAKILC